MKSPLTFLMCITVWPILIFCTRSYSWRHTARASHSAEKVKVNIPRSFTVRGPATAHSTDRRPSRFCTDFTCGGDAPRRPRPSQCRLLRPPAPAKRPNHKATSAASQRNFITQLLLNPKSGLRIINKYSLLRYIWLSYPM